MKKLGCIGIIILLLIVGIVFIGSDFFELSDDDNELIAVENSEKVVHNYAENSADTSWAIYLYLCGSDLESEGGFADDDLNELFSVKLPKNVKIIIQTGGSLAWKNSKINAKKTQRFIYDEHGFRLLEEFKASNFGKRDTLADFLDYSINNHPADKKVLVFWNHGGGSISGVAFDELFDGDSLTLDEISSALKMTVQMNPDKPVFDIVGFDACLMSTIDVAKTFYGYANYLTASEEYEPGGGWAYDGWVGFLAKNTGTSTEQLARVICDTYKEACVLEDVDDEITLSVIDLKKLPALISSYDEFGRVILNYSADDRKYATKYSRAAKKSENYGGNNIFDGYSNMVDLEHLAKNNAKDFPIQANAVINALKNCVVYKINGRYKEHSGGISCYHTYNKDADELDQLFKVCASDSFKYLNYYLAKGKMDKKVLTYLEKTQSLAPHDIATFESGTSYSTDYNISIDDNGAVVLKLDKKTLDKAVSVQFDLYYYDESTKLTIALGSDNDLISDWQNGVFKDKFNGKWGSIDSNLVFMELVFETDKYNIYSVPIKLNGKRVNLSVIYDIADSEYSILGARKPESEAGAANGDIQKLKSGDIIETMHFVVEKNAVLTGYCIDTITYGNDTKFYEAPLGDGTYLFAFKVFDSKNNFFTTDLLKFDYINDKIRIKK